jgi:5-methylcytosine-specific restriction enzyme subunit McrC
MMDRTPDGRPIVVLSEYQTRIVDRISPSAADEAAAMDPELRQRLGLLWGRGDRLTVAAGSYVGVVDLDCVRISIVPKLVGGSLAVLEMLEYVRGGASLNHLAVFRNLPTHGQNLRDLVCALLVAECEQLVRQGLRRDYVRRTDALPAMRGRMLADRQVLHRFGRLDSIECRYEEFDGDILDNQICAAGLDVAARLGSDDIRARSRRCAIDFYTICKPGRLDPRAVETKLAYHRLNEHYRPAHRWALLLLASGGFADLFAGSPWRGRAFLLEMNALFEGFATRLLRDGAAGTDVSVHPQASRAGIIWDEASHRSYSHVRPDVLLRGRDWQLPVDAKYKLYEDRKVSSADVYQSFLYAFALSSPPDGTLPSAVIFYPSAGQAADLALAIRAQDGTVGARIRAIGVSVDAVLRSFGSSEYRTVAAEILGRVVGSGP